MTPENPRFSPVTNSSSSTPSDFVRCLLVNMLRFDSIVRQRLQALQPAFLELFINILPIEYSALLRSSFAPLVCCRMVCFIYLSFSSCSRCSSMHCSNLSSCWCLSGTALAGYSFAAFVFCCFMLSFNFISFSCCFWLWRRRCRMLSFIFLSFSSSWRWRLLMPIPYSTNRGDIPFP